MLYKILPLDSTPSKNIYNESHPRKKWKNRKDDFWIDLPPLPQPAGKNGRTQKELNQVIEWITGFDEQSIQQLIKENVSFASFFEKANIHPNAHLITGVICGYRIEEIPEEFGVYRNCRYLDKLVDELAKGRKMEKILGRK